MGLLDSVFSSFDGLLGGDGEVHKNWKIAVFVLVLVIIIVLGFVIGWVLGRNNPKNFSGRNAGGCATCGGRAQGPRMQSIEWPASQFDDTMASKEFFDSTGMVRVQDSYNAVLPDNISYETSRCGFTGYKPHQFEPQQEKTLIKQKLPATNIIGPKWGESDFLNLLDN